jgi:hypothetical protein
MVVYDRYFGWDWDRIKAIAIGLFFLNALIAFVVSTEGRPWYYHFSFIFDWTASHAEATLIGLLVIGMGLYWWWRFEQGEI